MLEFTDAQIKKANAGTNLWRRFVILADTYPGQTSVEYTCKWLILDSGLRRNDEFWSFARGSYFLILQDAE
jgi:hypothetical protein